MVKIAHLGLSVSNLARSIYFYRKAFGFRCKEKYEIAAADLTICLLEKDGVCLELFKFKKYKALPQYRKKLDSDLKTLGMKHFSFGVKNIKQVYSRLKKAKVKFETNLRVFENGLRYFFIKDPDGILIEIMERD